MKKRLLSILLMCCMVLTLLPTAALAEGSEEELPVCTCETACTAESLNADCPVCGAEGASAENCAKYIKPADDAAVQPEGEVSDPQPGTALTALIGEGVMPTTSGAVTDVSTADELTKAIADSTVNTVRLAGDISSGSVITVKDGGNLTLTDSNTTAVHKFTPDTNGLWVSDENGSKTVTGGVITGGTGYPFPLSSTLYCGGGVYIAPGGQLTMTGGNIIGCSAEFGGGVCIYPRQNGEQIQFSMSGGSIIGCVASHSGGGVYASGKFQMSGPAVIRSCTVESTDQLIHGGGVYVDGSFEMSGEAKIEGCQAISSSAYGGGVYVNSSRSFVMSENAKIENCQAISKSSKGGGVYLSNNTKFTLSGSAVIQNCTAKNSATPGEAYGGGVSAANVREITLADSARIAGCIAENGSGLYITGSQNNSNYGNLYANGGSVEGDVVLGDYENYPCTITGTGGTVFKGKVTVAPGSTIKSGTFNGEVTNNGTITGGTFNGEVINNGTINDGVFTGIVSGNGKITGGTFNPLITGSGTVTDPYQIGTAEQLKRFRDIVNGSNGQTQNTAACATLTADIVLNDGTFDEDGNYTPGPSGAALTEWSPMGVSNSTVYAGTFDGAGHTIQGLYCNSNSHAPGLFGYIAGATIQDIRVTGHFNADKAEHAGCIVAYSQNSRITGCVSTASINGHHSFQSATGGIVGIADSSTQVSDCINYGTVKCITSESNFTNAGGIVGWLAGSSNITNCSNFGTVIGLTYGGYVPPIYVGGIVGSAWTKSISDCYNAGAVRIDEQGNSSAAQEAGGIAGFAGFNDTYPLQISNCYNVGSVTAANANAMLGGIVGCSGYDSVAITNCYYLTGTAGQVYGYGKATVTATTEKSAFDFGNGTVLALLINSRADSEHPWNSQCQYLAAAGKTLPVFKTQTGDKHTHDWSVWTSNGDDTHSRRCTCNAVETQNCSGGTATCKDKAKCAVCGAEYGDTNPYHHGDKLKHVVAKDATTSEEGNIEYWYCEACGKYFSDNAATKEITQAETVIPKRQSSGSNYSYYTIKATAGTGGSISPSGNVSVREGRDQTFTITPDKGYAVANVKIDGKSIGAVKSYTFENVSRTHTIEVIFMKANGNPQTGVFVDVATGSYYEDAVDWAVENGITNGVSSNMFAPDDPCTRAQIVTFLWRAAGSPAPKSMSSFTDVSADAFYAKAVAWAVENGITSGTGEGKFSPNAICTRAQSVTFLYRASGSPAVSGSAEFSDVSTTAFYADAVAWAAKKGITTGIGGGLFGSDNDCTRSQIVTFLWRCKK